MNKYSYEKLNDGFVNLYRQGIFIRCYEYTAIIISGITGYIVCPRCHTKNTKMANFCIQCGKKFKLLKDMEVVNKIY